jgi:hypothetical protein
LAISEAVAGEEVALAVSATVAQPGRPPAVWETVTRAAEKAGGTSKTEEASAPIGAIRVERPEKNVKASALNGPIRDSPSARTAKRIV